MSISRTRSISEPSLQVLSGNYTRERLRKTDLDYERGKDRLAHWIGVWRYEQVCALLLNLVARCPLIQMEYLWTVMESVPHRDFLYAAASTEDMQHPRPSSVLEGYFRPFSTPVSKKKTAYLKKSINIQNRRLHRAESISVCDGFESATCKRFGLNELYLLESPDHESRLLPHRPLPEGQKVPDLGFTSPPNHPSPFHKPHSPLPERDRAGSRVASFTHPVSTRILTPMRRHMAPSKSWTSSSHSSSHEQVEMHFAAQQGSRPITGHSSRMIMRHGTRPATGQGIRPATGHSSRLIMEQDTRPATGQGTRPATARPATARPTTGHSTRLTGFDTRPTTGLSFLTELKPTMAPLPAEVVDFLCWFSDIKTDWKQQELLQVVVWNLDNKELYFLSALVMSRQYRDFVKLLPEAIALELLSYVPAKDILSKCCRVSHSWNSRCSNESLWEMKHHQVKLGLPMEFFSSWKQYYLDDMRLKRNWTKGRRLQKKLVGHTRKVVSVCLKGNYILASGSADNTVRVWNLSTYECISVLEGHTNVVWCVRFYGKNLLISASGDSLIKIWNYQTNVCERNLSYHRGPVWAIQQKKDLLVSGGQDKRVCIWDVRTCQLLRALRGHKGVVFSVEMTDTTEKIYSGSRDNTIRVWHTESGLCLKCMKVSLMDPVLALHFNKGYLVGCYGRRITIWNTETWTKFGSFITHESRVDSVQLSMEDHHAKPTGLLLTASQDEKVKYWDLKSRRYKTLKEDDLGKVNSAEFNDLYVVCGSTEAAVKVWDFNPHSILRKQRKK